MFLWQTSNSGGELYMIIYVTGIAQPPCCYGPAAVQFPRQSSAQTFSNCRQQSDPTQAKGAEGETYCSEQIKSTGNQCPVIVLFLRQVYPLGAARGPGCPFIRRLAAYYRRESICVVDMDI